MEIIETYKFRHCEGPTPNAIALGEALAEIGATDPDNVLHVKKVVAARNDKRLKRFFTQDVKKAAYKCWADEAQEAIRSIETVRIESDTPEKPRPVEIVVHQTYSHLRTDREGYRRTELILQDDALRAALIAQAQADFDVYRRRYERLIDLCEAFDSMSRAIKRAKKKAKTTV